MSFIMIMQNQNMVKKQKCVIWIYIMLHNCVILCSIVYIKTDDIYKDITQDVETKFDTSNYELNRPLLKGKNKN